MGRRRKLNEDEYFLSPDGLLWIVADGMGGHAAGDVASALTVQAIQAAVGAGATLAADRLLWAFELAHAHVLERSHHDGSCDGMGSTAIAALLEGEILTLCHVGDVRGYHWSAGGLAHVTNDHSLVWQLVLAGLLPPERVRTHPHRGRVTQAIGSSQGIRPELTCLSLADRDRVLLCSDGLWECLEDTVIGKTVGANGSMRDLAVSLVDQANAAGGEDNITVVLYEYRAGSTAI